MASRRAREKCFETEAELCAAFIAWTKTRGEFTAYAETEGWDILLQHADGYQIGVQAKLRFTTHLLYQTLPDSWEAEHAPDARGPDFRAILVPEIDGEEDHICRSLGLVAFVPRRQSGHDGGYKFRGAFEISRGRAVDGAHDWNPSKRVKTPAYVPDVAAGVSSPIQLTPWKINALRVVAHLEAFGAITRAQIKAHGCHPSTWTTHWLTAADAPGEWVAGNRLPDFKAQHPVVFKQILEEVLAAGPIAPLPSRRATAKNPTQCALFGDAHHEVGA